jgi:hypothetical protein
MSRFSDWWYGREAEESDELERMVLEASELHGVPPKKVIKTVFEDEDDLDEEELLDDDDEDEEKPRSKVGLWVTIVFIGVFFGGAIVVLMWLSKLSDKAGPEANNYLQQTVKSIAPSPPAVPMLAGLYILFQYPPVFNNVQALPNLPTTSERYMIGSSADYHRTISVMVDKFGSLAGDSNYLVRQEDPSEYTPDNIKVEGEPAVVMVKGDGTEQTLFWAHAAHVVVVSIDSNNGTDNLAKYMAVVQTSLRWRQVPQ